MFPYVIVIKSSHAVSCNGGMTRGKDGGFCDIMINEDSDGVEAIRLGKFCDKVHGDHREWGSVRERWDWVERDRGSIR